MKFILIVPVQAVNSANWCWMFLLPIRIRSYPSRSFAASTPVSPVHTEILDRRKAPCLSLDRPERYPETYRHVAPQLSQRVEMISYYQYAIDRSIRPINLIVCVNRSDVRTYWFVIYRFNEAYEMHIPDSLDCNYREYLYLLLNIIPKRIDEKFLS